MSHHAHDHDHNHPHHHHDHNHDRAASESIWRVHPKWLLVVGFLLMALVMFTWIFIF